MNYSERFSEVSRAMGSSMIRELVASTKNIPDLISFAGGFPSPRTFPKDLLSEIYSEVVKTEGTDVLQYGQSEGDSLLKTELAKWDGYPELSLDQSLITVGSTNGIYYYTRALIDPGDVVICEAPSFLGCLVAFEAAGADLRGVPLDDEGIDLDALKAAVSNARAEGKAVKFVYTIPDFQNPAGITMSYQRRKNLIEYCLAEDLLILEDNPYSRLRYSGEAVPTIYRIAQNEYRNTDLVMEIVSFSKILGPGMRLAYAKGNEALIGKMGSWQQKVTVSPDCVTERVAARFLQKNLMDDHIAGICDFYRPYLHKMLDCLKSEMPDYVSWTKPEGGIFIWMWLPEELNADELFIQASQHKVTYIPGSKFYPRGQEKFNCLRLNFTYSSMEQIETGIARLGKLIKSI